MANLLDGVNPQLASGINGLISAVKAKGGNPILTSGYRSQAEQDALYANRANNPNPVGRTSMHTQGLAVDVSGDKNTLNLLHSLAGQYGLQFPFSNDPVHVQLAGKVNDTSKAFGTGTPSPNPDTPDPNTPQPLTFPQKMQVLQNMITPVAAPSTPTTDEVKPAGTEAQITGTEADTSTTESGITAQGGKTFQPAQMRQPAGPAQAGPGGGGGGGDLDSLMASIAVQESGGKGDPYSKRNPDSGAFGKYQIMPSNWASWAQQAGLPANAPQTPANQELVAHHKMNEYLQKYGAQGAAQAWYGGEGSVGHNVSGGSKYPTSNQYAASVTGRMK